MPRFFSYDGNGGGNYEEHDTAKEARAAAAAAIEYFTGDQPWIEDNVTGICWGEIRETSTIKNRREPTPDEKEEYPEWEFVADVVLQPVYLGAAGVEENETWLRARLADHNLKEQELLALASLLASNETTGDLSHEDIAGRITSILQLPE